MSRPFDFTRALVRRPGASAVKGLRAGDRSDPDLAGLLAEHAAYVAALRGAGLEVEELAADEGFPDGLFVEDPALVFPEAAILLHPGAPSRAGEVALLAPELAARFPKVLELPEGYADGGDVLDLGTRVLIGLSARTDRAGAEALAGLLDGLGKRAEVVEPPPGVLHLKTACSLVGEGVVLATPLLAATGMFGGLTVIETPRGEEGGANVLWVNDTLLVGAHFPGIADKLAGLGAAVVPLANREIARIDAGFTCMSLRW
ncbi:MAG: dimethylarginine dimethylaminohydrolase family protein [Novosphingobium sp.]